MFSGFSQRNENTLPPKDTYGIDHDRKLIIWNHKIPHDSVIKHSEKIVPLTFQDSFSIQIAEKDLTYTNSYELIKNSESYKLYITNLPLIHIQTSDTIRDEPKIRSEFSYVDVDTLQKAIAGIELRGNISLTFPKKSYDLEFWEDPVKKISTNVQFASLRKDDDWILDGLYNEPLRLRSYLANSIWLSVHKPHYQSKEKKAASGIDLIYTEVFLNNHYIGIHALTEQVDRKLLKIKKIENSQIQGELFKANSHEEATKFVNAPDFNNLFPHWGGFRMEYPVVDYKSYWNHLYSLIKLITNSDISEFTEKIANRYDLDNAIDYFICMNLFRATDNLSKNYFLARYDSQSPYFMVPWDLDGVFGTIQDGKRIATTNDMLSNGFFDRLLKDNPDNFRKKLQLRWKELRKESLSTASLSDKILRAYTYFEEHKVYEREQAVWPSSIPYTDHLTYLQNWLTQRLEFLDSYFSKL